MKPVPLRYVADSIQTGPFGSQLHAEDYTPGGTPVVNPAHLQDGRIVLDLDCAVDEETFARLSRHALGPGDVVLGRRGELGRSAVVQPEQAGWLCGTGSIRVRANAEKLDPCWLQCVLSSAAARDWLSLESVGSTMENLGAGVVGSLPIPLPSISRQREILSALDSAKSQVDLVVAAKQRLLDLLAEKRKAIIATAVTRGLDPKVKLRDSGVPLLGQIPAHWDVVPLRYLVSYGPKNGVSPPQTGTDGELSFSISAVREGRVTIDGNEKYIALERSVASDYYIKPGDILLVRGNGNLSLVGTCGLVDTAPDECTYPDILMLMRVGGQIVPELLVASVNSPYVRRQIESLAQTTNGTFKLSGEDVRMLRIAVPPMQEQSVIIEHIAGETAKLDAVRAATECTIALLKERRAALIAAAVTGQFDVTSDRPERGAA